MPLPFKNGEFDCVVAIEVIEHIKDYIETIREINRISKRLFIMSVPDISAIPRCFPQHVVPWHLLESTHFNFFTQRSLRKILSKYWSKINFIKIGRIQVNESSFTVSIVAVCEKELATKTQSH